MIVKTKREVAQHFGVTIQAVGHWRDNGCPLEQGKYDLEKIEEWKSTRPQNRATPDRTELRSQVREAVRLVLGEVLREVAQNLIAEASQPNG